MVEVERSRESLFPTDKLQVNWICSRCCNCSWDSARWTGLSARMKLWTCLWRKFQVVCLPHFSCDNAPISLPAQLQYWSERNAPRHFQDSLYISPRPSIVAAVRSSRYWLVYGRTECLSSKGWCVFHLMIQVCSPGAEICMITSSTRLTALTAGSGLCRRNQHMLSWWFARIHREVKRSRIRVAVPRKRGVLLRQCINRFHCTSFVHCRLTTIQNNSKTKQPVPHSWDKQFEADANVASDKACKCRSSLWQTSCAKRNGVRRNCHHIICMGFDTWRISIMSSGGIHWATSWLKISSMSTVIELCSQQLMVACYKAWFSQVIVERRPSNSRPMYQALQSCWTWEFEDGAAEFQWSVSEWFFGVSLSFIRGPDTDCCRKYTVVRG